MTKEEIKDIIISYSPEAAALMISQVCNEGRLSESQEEREAWTDCYTQTQTKLLASEKIDIRVNGLLDNLAIISVISANKMLAERRKRFGGKE